MKGIDYNDMQTVLGKMIYAVCVGIIEIEVNNHVLMPLFYTL